MILLPVKGFLPQPLKKKARGEAKQIQKNRLTEKKVEGKEKGRELGASREHRLMTDLALQTAAGIWLTQSFFL